MRNDTRLKYTAYLEQVALLSGVPLATNKFTVAASVQQTLETKIQESSSFLQSINIIGVTEQQGEKLGLGVGGPIAGRTDTAQTDRQTRDLTSLDSNKYNCLQTNYDSHLTYAKLDAWAKYPDFEARVRDAIIQRMALDRILIGFNGVSAAASTDIGANPLLQDVNIGWLQALRAYKNGAHFVKEVKAGSGKIKIGDSVAKEDGYKNLDALVMDLVSSIIEPWYQNDSSLVCVMGRGLLADKYFPLVNQAQPNSEKSAADLIISQKRVGGLPAVTAPFVPDGALGVTRLDNLSIYFQEGARRRTVVDNAKRDRIENYESSNDAYVVEDFGCFAAAENIELV